MAKAKTKATLRQIPDLIRDLEPFEGNSMWASAHARLHPGWLNDHEAAQYAADLESITYVVYSYWTPIAWVTRDGRVHIVDQKFSITTTRHQSCLYALNGNFY
jgi:hypothetical protein